MLKRGAISNYGPCVGCPGVNHFGTQRSPRLLQWMGSSSDWDHKKNKTFTIVCSSLLHLLVEPGLATVTAQRKEVVPSLLEGFVRQRGGTTQDWLPHIPARPQQVFPGEMACFGAILLPEWLFLYSQLSAGPTHVAKLSGLSPLWLCPPGLRLCDFRNPLYFQVVTACEMAREGSILCSPHLLAEKPNQIVTHGYLRHCKIKLRIPADKL